MVKFPFFICQEKTNICKSRKSNKTPNIQIIPRLHMLGGQIRQRQHLYEGYKNLIQRILELKATPVHGHTTPPTLSGFGSDKTRGVFLAQSSSQRFERLGDRIQLLILSEINELLAEKDALISTVSTLSLNSFHHASTHILSTSTSTPKKTPKPPPA